jgi:hypothetical protein
MKSRVKALLARTAIVWKGWDFYAGVAGAGFAAIGVASSRGVRDNGITILLAEAAVGVALLGCVLAALQIFAPSLDSLYRRILDQTEGGVAGALAPYMLTAAVAGLAAVAGVIAALLWPSFGVTMQTVATSVATLFAVYSIAATVSLVQLSIMHARLRARLLGGVDEAEAILARRLTPTE